MPEARFTELPALSVDLRVWVSRSVSYTDDELFFLPLNGKNRSFFFITIYLFFPLFSHNYRCLSTNIERHLFCYYGACDFVSN